MQRNVNGLAMAIVWSLGGANVALATEPTPAQMSFITTAAQTGMMEVEAAKAAVGASKNVAVKEFAYRIIYDYEKINSDLAKVAEKRGIVVPSELDAEHARILQSLRETSPPAFDAAYFAGLAPDRARTVELLQSNLLNPDAELAVFSSYNLPRVREHKRLADELKGGLAR